MTVRRFSLLLAIGMSVTPALAQDDAVWQPLTGSEWSSPGDSTATPSRAVMLFERVLADERDLDEEKAFVSVYRRILLLSREAREWADVRLAYNPEEEEIDRIAGRTILRDGRTVDLDQAAVHDREVVRVDDASEREKFFTLPGVEDTCIIEYRYRVRASVPKPVWIAQKTIPLRYWEYRWRFFNPKLSAYDLLLRRLYFIGTAPNYLWVNSTKNLDITILPNTDDPEEVFFRTTDLPAFEEEPLALPDEALKAHLRAYYSSDLEADHYWSFVSQWLGEEAGMFFGKSDDLTPIVDSIRTLPPGTDRGAAASDWVRENIRLVSDAGSTEKYEENASVNDVLKHRYGTHLDLNLVFHRIVEGIPGYQTFLVRAADRSKRLFYTDAKHWQFDQSVVGVLDSDRMLKYYSPGDEGTAPGQIPWYVEGGTALVVGAGLGGTLFVDLPNSDHRVNSHRRNVTMSLNADGTATAAVREVLTGHQARKIRVLLGDLPPAEQTRVLEREVSENLEESWRGELKDVGVEFHAETVRVAYTMSGPGLPGGAGTVIVKPFSFLPVSGNPLVADRRKQLIAFEYAETVIDTLTLIPGAGWTVDTKPQPVWLANGSGSVEVRAEDLPEGVRILSRSIRKSAIYPKAVYFEVKAILAGQSNLRNVEVVLAEKPRGK